ncbi:hypothetical protein [Rhodococcus koreensis]
MAHAEVVEVVFDGFLAVAAVGGDRACGRSDTVLQAQESGEAATFTGSISGFGRFAYFDTAGQHLAVEVGGVGGGTGVTEMFVALRSSREWAGTAGNPIGIIKPAD